MSARPGDFDPLSFLERAVRTPSHEEPGAMRDLLVETLESHGVSPTVDDAGNVVIQRGPIGGPETDAPHYVLNTHVDTVPPHVPFERDGDVLRGRGSCDAKGPLAALLAGFLDADLDAGTLTLAVTSDEETLSTGAHALVERGLFDGVDGVLVGEPTGLDACNAARGRFEGTITLRGEAAHAADPAEGVNAVRALREVVDALDSYDAERGPPVHATLGPPTLTPTTVEGGAATNQIPAVARLTVDRRSVPPETADEFRDGLREHLRAAVPDDVDVSFAFTERDTPFLEAFATPADDPLVTAVADAARSDVRPFGAATEASYFAAHAPTVVFGPGDLADDEGPVAHADREYVRASEVERAADVATRALDSLFSD